MKYAVIKNKFVLGKLCKAGVEIEIDDVDLPYYGDCIEIKQQGQTKQGKKKHEKQ